MSYVGQKVKEEGSYLFHNCLKFYLDKELRYPVRLSLNDMLPNVRYEMEGIGKMGLLGALANLDDGETFNWVIYGQYVNPNNDVIIKLEVAPSKDMENFITVKVSRLPLKSGDKFKVLFTFTNNSYVDKFFNNPKANAAFSIMGKGQRKGTG